MTRSLLRPIRTRRIVRSSTPPPSETNSTNSITPGTRKTLAVIGALWVSFAVSASTASAKPALSDQQPLTLISSASDAQVSPARDHDLIGLQADGHAPRFEKGKPEHGGSRLVATKSAAQRIVFITTGDRADAFVPRPPEPELRRFPARASTALAYLKSISK